MVSAADALLRTSLLALVLHLGGCAARLDATMPYERNVAVQDLEGKREAAPAAIRALEDPDWRVAANAASLATRQALRPVARAAARLLEEKRFDDQRLEYLLRLVGTVGTKEHAAAIVDYLRHRRPTVRVEAVKTCTPDQLGQPGLEPAIEALLRDRDREVRVTALAVLGRYRSESARIVVALRIRDWYRLAEMKATRQLLSGLKTVDATEQSRLWETVMRCKTSNPDFMAAVLSDPSLEPLHQAALGYLEERKESPETVSQIKERLLKLWTARIDEHLKRCEGKDWYTAYSELKSWVERPPYSFIVATASKAVAVCRDSALRVVEREAAEARQ